MKTQQKNNKKKQTNTSEYSSFWFDDNYYSGYDSLNNDDDFEKLSEAELSKLSPEEQQEYKDELEAARLANRNIKLIKLGAFMRSIKNFVNILTGKDIPVKYSSNDSSYTDGEIVTLSANIENNFDSSVGLALHEASHICLTDFNLLVELLKHNNRETLLNSNDIDKISKLLETDEKLFPKDELGNSEGPNYQVNSKNTIKKENAYYYLFMQFKDIVNWIEDRRIDNHIYETAPGYRGYYEALYDRYFYSAEVSKSMKDSKLNNTETFTSYMFHLINSLNDNFDSSKLKGLKEIVELIDVKNIDRLKSTKDVFEVAGKVLNVITKNVVAVDDLKEMIKQAKMQQALKDMLKESGGYELSADDIDKMTNEQVQEIFGISKSKLKSLLKDVNAQKVLLNGKIKKTKVSAADANTINTYINSGTTIEQAGGEEWSGKMAKVILINKLTFDVLKAFPGVFDTPDSQWTSFDNENAAIKKGFIFGKMLAKQMQTRKEDRSLIYTRLDKGKIDKRLVSNLGFGVESIFSKTEHSKYSKSHIHISIDASGSMSGDKWYCCMTMAVAVAVACKLVGNIACTISGRSTFSGQSTPVAYIAYDSKVNGLGHINKYFRYLNAGGTTPESLCFEAMINKHIFPKVRTDEHFYFLNISDGEPTCTIKEFKGDGYYDSQYYGDKAYKHCRRMMNRLESEYNAKIISFYVQNSERYWSGEPEKTKTDSEVFLKNVSADFKKMYGANNSFGIYANNVRYIALALNKKFMENGLIVNTI